MFMISEFAASEQRKGAGLMLALSSMPSKDSRLPAPVQATLFQVIVPRPLCKRTVSWGELVWSMSSSMKYTGCAVSLSIAARVDAEMPRVMR